MSLRIGDTAPDFEADTTEGPISFHDWIGDSWAVLFSHPKDFTPVCTTELGYMASINPAFEKRGVKILGLSVDSLDDHEEWAKDIERTQGTAPNYPIVADPEFKVAKAYEMLPADVSGDASARTPVDNQTVRNVFVIGPDKKIKLILIYPMSAGRNFDEVLRVVDSLQLTADHKVSTPAQWQRGEDVIIAGSVSDEEAARPTRTAGSPPRPTSGSSRSPKRAERPGSGSSTGPAIRRPRFVLRGGLASSIVEGTEFAGHLIEEEIGRGGMGIVYRARHLALDRIRALKVLSPELSEDPTYVARFRRESRLAASVDHPAVVTVHHAGEEDGRLYMSMQYVDGVDLGRLLADGPLSPARAGAILDQLAAGLDAAHAAGLIHRDVKPENVLLSGARDAERAYLTDFGIGTVAGTADRRTTRLTAEGIVLGTSSYMAPEQIDGDAVDRRADVYSLACVAFHMLTGEPPFAGRSELATLSAHGSAPRPQASAIVPALSGRLDDALAAGMAINPSARPDSASAFSARLGAAIAGGSGARTSPSPQPRRGRRRTGPLAFAAVAITTAAAIVAVLALAGDEDGDTTADVAAPPSFETPRDPVAVAVGAERIWVAGQNPTGSRPWTAAANVRSAAAGTSRTRGRWRSGSATCGRSAATACSASTSRPGSRRAPCRSRIRVTSPSTVTTSGCSTAAINRGSCRSIPPRCG